MFKNGYPPNGVSGSMKVGVWGMEFPIRQADEGTCTSAARQACLPELKTRRSKALCRNSINPKRSGLRTPLRSGHLWNAGGVAPLSIHGRKLWTHSTRFFSVLKTQTNG